MAWLDQTDPEALPPGGPTSSGDRCTGKAEGRMPRKRAPTDGDIGAEQVSSGCRALRNEYGQYLLAMIDGGESSNERDKPTAGLVVIEPTNLPRRPGQFLETWRASGRPAGVRRVCPGQPLSARPGSPEACSTRTDGQGKLSGLRRGSLRRRASTSGRLADVREVGRVRLSRDRPADHIHQGFAHGFLVLGDVPASSL